MPQQAKAKFALLAASSLLWSGWFGWGMAMIECMSGCKGSIQSQLCLKNVA